MSAAPKLRGLFVSQLKRDTIIGMTLAISAGVAYKVFVGDKRKRTYAEFYRTYDADADFERMLALGLFKPKEADD